MMRKIALAVAFGIALPATALACNDKNEQVKATTDDGQQIVLAQADPSKPAKKPTKKKAPKKNGAPKKTEPK